MKVQDKMFYTAKKVMLQCVSINGYWILLSNDKQKNETLWAQIRDRGEQGINCLITAVIRGICFCTLRIDLKCNVQNYQIGTINNLCSYSKHTFCNVKEKIF